MEKIIPSVIVKLLLMLFWWLRKKKLLIILPQTLKKHFFQFRSSVFLRSPVALSYSSVHSFLLNFLAFKKKIVILFVKNLDFLFLKYSSLLLFNYVYKVLAKLESSMFDVYIVFFPILEARHAKINKLLFPSQSQLPPEGISFLFLFNRVHLYTQLYHFFFLFLQVLNFELYHFFLLK